MKYGPVGRIVRIAYCTQVITPIQERVVVLTDIDINR